MAPGEALQTRAPGALRCATCATTSREEWLKCTCYFCAVPKLIVPGNHDLWLPEGDSLRHYREELPALYRAHGFHMLDTGPVVVGGVGFAGVLGWYDYSLRDPALVLGPKEAYETSRFHGHVVRNDKIFVRLGMSDPEFCAEQLATLERQLEDLSGRVDRIVVITHVAGLAEMVLWRTGDEVKNFESAYLGSAGLGLLLARFPKVTHHFCGHIHRLCRVRKESYESVSVGSTYREKRFEALDLA